MKKSKTAAVKTIRLVSALVTVVVLGVLAYGLINIAELDESVYSLIHIYGIPALFGISILLDLIPQLISPVMALGTGIIAGINVHYAIASTILGSVIGSVIGFALGKKYMFDAVYAMASEKSVEKLTTLTNKYGKIIVPLAAISPLPYLPVFLGAINLSKRNFVLYGIVPRVLSFIIFGYLVSAI